MVTITPPAPAVTPDRTSDLPSTVVGSRVNRKEDQRLIQGLGNFGHDVQRPRMLHARIVRANVAHARITEIDCNEAQALPGVIAVLTGHDLPHPLHIPVRLRVQNVDLDPYLQPILPTDEVRYVGEPIAIVVAEDAYLAEDAAEMVLVEYDELPVVMDTTSDPETSVCATFNMGYGQLDGVFEHAAHMVNLTFDIGRHSAVPMEPRTLVVDPVGLDSLEIFGATKVPVFNRRVLSDLLELDEQKIHMHAMDAGGGFGVRGEFYPEDFLIPWVAQRTRRPVSWCEDRAEHMVSVNHSRQQQHQLSLALDADGSFLGLRAHVIHDNGAYARTHGIIVPELTLAMLPGPYRIPAYRGEVTVALSNKTPCGTYRGPGRFEGTASREALIDEAASQLGIDRIELRRHNLLTRDELPHARAMNTLGTDVVIDQGDFVDLYDKALTRARDLGWLQAVDAGGADGHHLGLGVAMFMEKSGLGPDETADVEVTRRGRVRVYSGGTSLGQGIETALAQIACDVLPVGIENIDVINGDTDQQPFGTGSWASRSTVLAGNAVRGACEQVAARLIELASRMMECSVDELIIDDSRVVHRLDVSRSRTFAQIAAASVTPSAYVLATEPAGLRRRYRFTVDHMTYPYGCHIALVDVHSGTGKIDVLGYLVAYEVGVAVNPSMVEGQLRGGIAQGIGGALFEEFRYDEAGQPQSTTFMDYLMPTASEVPDLELLVLTDHPAGTNPLGVRGAGEGGLTAAGGCVASAVRDALSRATGKAIPVTTLPITPSFTARILESAGNVRV